MKWHVMRFSKLVRWLKWSQKVFLRKDILYNLSKFVPICKTLEPPGNLQHLASLLNPIFILNIWNMMIFNLEYKIYGEYECVQTLCYMMMWKHDNVIMMMWKYENMKTWWYENTMILHGCPLPVRLASNPICLVFPNFNSILCQEFGIFGQMFDHQVSQLWLVKKLPRNNITRRNMYKIIWYISIICLYAK